MTTTTGALFIVLIGVVVAALAFGLVYLAGGGASGRKKRDSDD